MPCLLVGEEGQRKGVDRRDECGFCCISATHVDTFVEVNDSPTATVVSQSEVTAL